MNRFHISENKLDRSNFLGPNFLGFDFAQPAKVLFTQPAKVLSACVEARVEARVEVVRSYLRKFINNFFGNIFGSCD